MSRATQATEIVVFGRRVVQEALVLEQVEPLELRVAERTPGELRHALHAAARARGLEAQVVHAREVSALSGEPRHDQGIVLRLRLQQVMEVESFLASRTGKSARAATRVLAFDGLTNSQNIGMIVRSALASEIDALLWPVAGVPWINGLVVKASSGTVLRAPVVRCHTLAEGLAAFQGAGFECLGLDAGGDHSLFELEASHRLVVAVGNETHGLSADVRSQLDGTFSIPMGGGVESLNAAVAASLVCYRLFEQRVSSPRD